ncbi:DUF998 domain-containing protein [Glycomyces sp. NPDC046736]|uniref:DUF998 domain-containing protein n=1 Tax=Glycomyces sp. NPDC046736 TaxID=3155615 RepID=UPI0033C34C93
MKPQHALVLAGSALTAAAFALSDVVNREMSPVAETVSRFVNTGHGWLVTLGLWGFVLAAAALTLAVPDRAGRVLFGVLTAGVLLAAVFPADPPGQWANPSTAEQIHGLAAWIGLICANVAMLLLSRRWRGREGMPGSLGPVAVCAAIAMGLFMVCTFDAMFFRALPSLIGVTERLAIAADLAWMCLAAVGLGARKVGA